MNKDNQYFKVHSCIKIVKGYKLGLLYDLQRKEYVQLPLELCEVLINQNNNVLSIKELEASQFHSCIEQFKGFLTWLVKHDYIFFCNSRAEAELFPEISTEWNNIDLLINAIIDIDNNSKYDIHNAITNLQKINCHSIQFRFFSDCDVDTLIKILGFTSDKSFQNLEIILPYHESFSNNILSSIASEFPNLVCITFFNSPKSNSLIKNQLSVFYISVHFKLKYVL